jgi:hypothetical protein
VQEYLHVQKFQSKLNENHFIPHYTCYINSFFVHKKYSLHALNIKITISVYTPNSQLIQRTHLLHSQQKKISSFELFQF